MISFQKTNLFSENIFLKIKDFCFEQSKFFDSKCYSDMFGRYYRLVFFPEDIHNEILLKAKEFLSDSSLKIVYGQIIKYQLKGDIIPQLESHKDNLNSDHIINLVIDSTIDWPLCVEDLDGNMQEFPSIVNSAVFLKGDQEGHWRKRYPSDSESDYLFLLFVHISPEDRPSWQMAKQVYDLPEAFREKVARSFLPGIGEDKLYKK
jgi:hypothetical protein